MAKNEAGLYCAQPRGALCDCVVRECVRAQRQFACSEAHPPTRAALRSAAIVPRAPQRCERDIEDTPHSALHCGRMSHRIVELFSDRAPLCAADGTQRAASLLHWRRLRTSATVDRSLADPI